MKNDKIKAEKRGFEVKTIIGFVCPDVPEDIDNFMREYDNKIRADTLDSVEKWCFGNEVDGAIRIDELLTKLFAMRLKGKALAENEANNDGGDESG